MYTPLNKAKEHLRVDFNEDDNYILDLIQTAECVLERDIDRPLCELEQSNGMLPAALQHAVMLLIGTWYANRESVVFSNAIECPQTYWYLINTYRNITVR